MNKIPKTSWCGQFYHTWQYLKYAPLVVAGFLSTWIIASCQVGDVSFRVAMDRLSLCLFGDFIILWECSPPILEEDLLNFFFLFWSGWFNQQLFLNLHNPHHAEWCGSPFCCLWIFWFQELANCEISTWKVDKDVRWWNTFQYTQWS